LFDLVLLSAGIAFFCVWAFLHVDDNSIVQNRLTDLSVWAESMSKSISKKTRSSEEGFLRAFVKMTISGFDYLLGKQLISARALSVSLCLSLSSFGVSMIALAGVSASYKPYILPSVAWSVSFGLVAVFGSQWLRYLVSGASIITAFLIGVAIFIAPESSLLIVARPHLSTNLLRILSEVELTVDEIASFRNASDAELTEEGFSGDEIGELRRMTDAEVQSSFKIENNERVKIAKAMEKPLASIVVNLPDYKPLGIQGRTSLAAIVGVSLLLAILSHVGAIIMTRKFLRSTDYSRSTATFIGFALPNVVLFLMLFVIPFWLGFLTRMPYQFDVCFALLATMNLTVVFVALSWVVLGIGLLTNRILSVKLVGCFDTASTLTVDTLRRYFGWLTLSTLGATATFNGLKWLISLLEL
jgi:hypothetical protein